MVESCALLGKLAKLVQRARWCIIVCWVVAGSISALGAMQFMSVATLAFDPPPGTVAHNANQHFASVLPELATSTNFVALLAIDESQKDVLSVPGMFKFSLALRDAVNSTGKLLSFTSNATLWADDNVSSGAALVSKDGRTTILQWVTADKPTSQASLHFATFAQEQFDEQVKQWLPGISFSGLTSAPTVCNLGVADGAQSLESMDGIALPLAFVILWYAIQSGRLLIIPLVNLGVSLSVSFGVMYCVALLIDVEETTPMLMMSLLIAMSIDYALFMLTRFREELAQIWAESVLPDTTTLLGSSEWNTFVASAVNEALERVLTTAGFTVLLSCVTLLTSFLAVAVFPVAIISSMGIGCAISLFVLLVANLTLGPAIISAFPSFFIHSVSPERVGARCFEKLRKSCCCSRRAVSGADDPAAGADDAGGTSGCPATSSARRALVSEASSKGHSPFWIGLARVTTTFPANLVIVLGVVAITVAVGIPVLRFQITDNMSMGIPRGTNTYDTYQRLQAAFGSGMMMPYRLLVQPKAGGSVLDPTFWLESQELLSNLSTRLPLTDGTSFQFANFAAGFPIEHQWVTSCMRNRSSSPLCAQVLYLVNQFTNKEKTAMYGYISLKFDAAGNDGPGWLSKARDVTDEMSLNSNCTFTLVGLAADALDLISMTYKYFTYMVPAVLATVLVMLGVAYKSVVIPLRSVASIILTLLWVFGGAVLVYQDGVLDWMGLPGISSTFKASSWIIPVICFSLVVGICLDYDIFLLTRITEYRNDGYDPIEAIRLGLCSTGGIITLAGVVMTIAFGGLCFASMFDVNALSFYMVFAVLYDTFIVRCLFAPAVMSFMGRFNWYPSSLSKADCGGAQAAEQSGGLSLRPAEHS